MTRQTHLVGHPAIGRPLESEIDHQYYEAAPPRSLAERLMIVARDRIYSDFLRLCAPAATDRILDVGVSDVINDGANLLERKDRYPDRITAVGLGSGQAFRKAFPRVLYRQIEANQPLPFADSQFRFAVSNAVLEHVGSRAHQAFFLQELARVAATVFVTVPHRYFPIEHHTALPLVHYWRPAFGLACRITGKSAWADEANLILMSRRGLAQLAPTQCSMQIGMTGLALGPLSSNLYALIQRRPV